MNKDPCVVFHPQYVKLLDGDVLAALMLSQIFYWYSPTKQGHSKLRCYRNGKWWLAKSAVEWEGELGMSPAQARRSLSVLCEKGLIETCVLQFKGIPTTHLRLISIVGKGPLIDPMSIFHLGSKTNGIPEKVKSYTETTDTESTEKIKPASKLAGEGVEEPFGEEDMKASEVLKLHLQGKEEKKSAATPLALSLLWKKTLAETTGTFVKDCTSKERGQLKLIIKALGAGAPAVVVWALQNWSSFVYKAGVENGGGPSPLYPQVGFLLQNVGVAKRMLDASVVTNTNLDAGYQESMVDSPTLVVEDVKVSKDKKVTPEEVLASMASLGIELDA